MPIARGSLSTTSVEITPDGDAQFYSLSFTNRSSSSVTLRVEVKDTELNLYAIGEYNKVLAAGEYYLSAGISTLVGDALVVTATGGPLDYYIQYNVLPGSAPLP